jgi:hypothetical protein
MSALHDKQFKFAQDVAKLIQYITSIGYSCTLGEAYRTAEQAAIYAHNGTGIRNSQHCERLAIDLNLFDNKGEYISAYTDKYQKIGDYWESLDAFNKWGGYFSRKDCNHFEASMFSKYKQH